MTTPRGEARGVGTPVTVESRRSSDPAGIVDALTEAGDHVAFAKGVLGRAGTGASQHTELNSRIKAIEHRLADPLHYLAVIGEFNSGKSTLINALLRDPLLSTNPWPTTQAVTRLQYGERVVLRCRFRGDRQQYTFPAPAGELSWRSLASKLRTLPGISWPTPSDLSGMLALLTADERVAPAVRSVTIDHPAAMLADGLVVIDTPGTNAEAGHTEIARQVLTDDADAAVVLFAADNPLGDSLAEFLVAALDAHLLSRCVFVVTKMANVDEQDEQRFLDVVGRRISSKLAVVDPVVLPVSVGPVVRELQGRTPKDYEKRWIGRFGSTEVELRDVLARQRAIAVSDRVLRLLHELLDKLRKDLEVRRADVRHEEQALESSDLVDLDGFITAQRSRAEKKIRQQTQTTRIAVGRALDRFEQTLVEQAVSAVPGDSSTRRQRVEEVVRSRLTELERSYKADYQALGRATRDTARIIDRAFAKEYAKLAPLTSADTAGLPAAPKLDADELSTVALRDIWDLHARHDTTENLLMGTGAAAGAVVGTMVLPIIGTAIGALLGAGSILIGSARREQAMQAQVSTSMRAVAGQVREQLEQHTTEVGTRCAALVTRRLTVSRAHYQPLVRAVVRRHREHQQSLRDRQKALDVELGELKRRDKRVDGQRRRIAATGRR